MSMMLQGATMAKWHRSFTPEQLADKQRRDREYRARKKAAGISLRHWESCIRSDAALEAAILMRGRQLTEMMRTPMCMWPSDWLSDD